MKLPVQLAHRNDFRTIGNWFNKSLMVLNAKKCHYVYLGNGSQSDDLLFNEIKLPNNCEKET